jgi:hypothetical protein
VEASGDEHHAVVALPDRQIAAIVGRLYLFWTLGGAIEAADLFQLGGCGALGQR